MTRHYIGKSAELDHVIINPKIQSKGYGKILIDWIIEYLKSQNIDACELNAYVKNRRSHKFYKKEDFKIYGYHFLRILRDDNEFY
ncbi:MAG: GNAT family N-acetyltransferase, partial [Saprospiraceae bacterium]